MDSDEFMMTSILMIHRLTAHILQVGFCKHPRRLSHSLKLYCFSDTDFMCMCCVIISSVTSTFIVFFVHSQWHNTFISAFIKSIKWPRSTDVCVSPPLYKQKRDSWQTVVFHCIPKSPTASGPCPQHSVMTLLCVWKELFKKTMGKFDVSLNVPRTSL